MKISKRMSLETARMLWAELEDIPFDFDEDKGLVLAVDWRHFPAGTHREDIWHWFEDTFDVSIHDDFMFLNGEEAPIIMTKLKCRKRIKAAVDTLNSLNHKLTFSFKEDEDALYLEAENSVGNRFGTYEITVFFDEYPAVMEIYAYTSFLKQVKLLIAGTKLEDPNAYHNLY